MNNSNNNNNTKSYHNYGRVLTGDSHTGPFTVIKNGRGANVLVSSSTGEYITNPAIMFNSENFDLYRVGKGTFVRPYFKKKVNECLSTLEESDLPVLDQLTFLEFTNFDYLTHDEIATIMNASVSELANELLTALMANDRKAVETELNHLFSLGC